MITKNISESLLGIEEVARKRKLYRRRMCAFIRGHITLFEKILPKWSYDKLRRKSDFNYLGDYSDNYLIKYTNMIIQYVYLPEFFQRCTENSQEEENSSLLKFVERSRRR